MNQNTETVVTLVHHNVAVRDTLEYCLQKNVYDVKAFAAKKNTLLNEIDNNTPLKAILDNSGDNGKKMDEAIRKMVEEVYGENSTICKVSGDNLIVDHAQHLAIFGHALPVHDNITAMIRGVIQDGERKAAAEQDEAKKAAADAIVESLKDKIDEIYARLDNGESFESLIPEYGEDPGMTGDTLQDGYPVHIDSTTYMQEFTDGAFSDKMLNVGDVSDPVVTNYGVHILHYVRDIPGGAVDMTDEMHESICDYLVQTAQSAQIEAWRDELTVEYTDAYNALIGK